MMAGCIKIWKKWGCHLWMNLSAAAALCTVNVTCSDKTMWNEHGNVLLVHPYTDDMSVICSGAVSGTVWSRVPLSVCLAVVLPGCSTRDNTVYESFGCATVVLYAPSCGCVAVSCLSLSGSLGETLCSHLLCSERPLCDGRILPELRC